MNKINITFAPNQLEKNIVKSAFFNIFLLHVDMYIFVSICYLSTYLLFIHPHICVITFTYYLHICIHFKEFDNFTLKNKPREFRIHNIKYIFNLSLNIFIVFHSLDFLAYS